MKRLISALIIAALVFTLCACGATDNTPLPENEVPAADGSGEKDSGGSVFVEEEPDYAADRADLSAENGRVLLDNDDLKLTVKECRYVPYAPEAEVVMECENRHGTDLELFSDLVVVNGWSVSSYGYGVIPAGETGEYVVAMMTEDFEKAGFENADEIRFPVTVSEAEGEFTYLSTDEFVIYPTGKSADEISSYSFKEAGYISFEYEDNETGFAITDARYIDGGFYQLDCVLENRSDERRVYMLKDVKVDGEEIDPYWSVSVPAGAKAMSYIWFDELELEELGAQECNRIDFTFVIANYLEDLVSFSCSYAPAKG